MKRTVIALLFVCAFFGGAAMAAQAVQQSQPVSASQAPVSPVSGNQASANQVPGNQVPPSQLGYVGQMNSPASTSGQAGQQPGINGAASAPYVPASALGSANPGTPAVSGKSSTSFLDTVQKGALSDYFEMLGILFGFIALLWFVLWLFKRSSRKFFSNKNAPMVLESRLAIAPKKWIVVARVYGKRIAMGVTDEQITLLAVLDEDVSSSRNTPVSCAPASGSPVSVSSSSGASVTASPAAQEKAPVRADKQKAFSDETLVMSQPKEQASAKKALHIANEGLGDDVFAKLLGAEAKK